jgi:hypothetical protein
MVTNGESQDKLKWAFQLYDKGTSTPPPNHASPQSRHRVACTGCWPPPHEGALVFSLHCPIAACALALTTMAHVFVWVMRVVWDAIRWQRRVGPK